MAIVRNPDEAYSEPPVKGFWATEAAAPAAQSVFNLRQRAAFLEQRRWIDLLVPLAGLWAASAIIAQWKFSFTKLWLIAEILATVLVFLLTCFAELVWSARFARRMRRILTGRLHPSKIAVFVGMHPGRGVRYTEGFPDWDFGFLELKGDWLCYTGEKAQFTIPRQDIADVSIAKGPMTWIREHRVQVVFSGGALTLCSDLHIRVSETRCV